MGPNHRSFAMSNQAKWLVTGTVAVIWVLFSVIGNRWVLTAFGGMSVFWCWAAYDSLLTTQRALNLARKCNETAKEAQDITRKTLDNVRGILSRVEP
jgi:hypothetical protein